MAETKADELRTVQRDNEFNKRQALRAGMLVQLNTSLQKLLQPAQYSGDTVEHAYSSLKEFATDGKTGQIRMTLDDFRAMSPEERIADLRWAIAQLQKASDPTIVVVGFPEEEGSKLTEVPVQTVMMQFKERLRQTLAWLDARLQ